MPLDAIREMGRDYLQKLSTEVILRNPEMLLARGAKMLWSEHQERLWIFAVSIMLSSILPSGIAVIAVNILMTSRNGNVEVSFSRINVCPAWRSCRIPKMCSQLICLPEKIC